jgi:hypothetical protein
MASRPSGREAWAGSTRRGQLPPDWPQRRAFVRERAGGRCQDINDDSERCPLPGTDCDHIRPGQDHSYANLQWLCPGHHRVKSAREGAQARVPLHRPRERHPGIL